MDVMTAWIVLVLGLLLHIYLCKQENKWLGLIFPIGSFLYSFFMISVGFAVLPNETPGGIIFIILTTLVVANIPTAILLGIYAWIRKNRERAS